MAPSSMLKHYKEEYDRLIEIYPPIVPKVVMEFNKKMGGIVNLVKPEICDSLLPTTIFNMTEEQRQEMIKRFQPPVPDTPDDSNPEDAEPEVIPEDPKIIKFKTAFFKINNRNPTEEEIEKVRDELFEGDSNV
jgi:hypothetical protein